MPRNTSADEEPLNRGEDSDGVQGRRSTGENRTLRSIEDVAGRVEMLQTELQDLDQQLNNAFADLHTAFQADRRQEGNERANALATLEKQLNQFATSLAALEASQDFRSEIRSESDKRRESIEALKTQAKETEGKADKTSNHLLHAIWAFSFVLTFLIGFGVFNFSQSVRQSDLQNTVRMALENESKELDIKRRLINEALESHENLEGERLLNSQRRQLFDALRYLNIVSGMPPHRLQLVRDVLASLATIKISDLAKVEVNDLKSIAVAIIDLEDINASISQRSEPAIPDPELAIKADITSVQGVLAQGTLGNQMDLSIAHTVLAFAFERLVKAHKGSAEAMTYAQQVTLSPYPVGVAYNIKGINETFRADELAATGVSDQVKQLVVDAFGDFHEAANIDGTPESSFRMHNNLLYLMTRALYWQLKNKPSASELTTFYPVFGLDTWSSFEATADSNYVAAEAESGLGRTRATLKGTRGEWLCCKAQYLKVAGQQFGPTFGEAQNWLREAIDEGMLSNEEERDAAILLDKMLKGAPEITFLINAEGDKDLLEAIKKWLKSTKKP
jgi:hypothetical protein